MSIGDNIKRKRLEKGYTLEELAQQIKTSKQTIHRYENGIISNIPSDKIEAIATALDTTPSYLMGWEEEKTTSKDDEECPEEIVYAIEHLDELELDPVTGIQIRTQREKKGISQAELATALNNLYHTKFSEFKIKQWEMGFPAPTKSEKIMLAKYFNFPIGFLDDNDMLSFALYGNDSKEITPEIIEEVRRYAQYLKDQKKNNNP